MQTKAHQRFRARVAAYEEDLELSSALVTKFITNTVNNETSLAITLEVGPDSHPKLHNRRNTKQSRTIVGRHLLKTLYASFMKDIYEDFGEYLSKILNIAALSGITPQRFLAQTDLRISLPDIMAAGSWENLISNISNSMFRSLENEKSTIELIRKIDNKLGLSLDITIINEAMPFLDARHIIVHRNGIPDEVFIQKYPNVILYNNSIKLDFLFYNNARLKICALARHIDQRLLAVNLFRPIDVVNIPI